MKQIQAIPFLMLCFEYFHPVFSYGNVPRSRGEAESSSRHLQQYHQVAQYKHQGPERNLTGYASSEPQGAGGTEHRRLESLYAGDRRIGYEQDDGSPYQQPARGVLQEETDKGQYSSSGHYEGYKSDSGRQQQHARYPQKPSSSRPPYERPLGSDGDFQKYSDSKAYPPAGPTAERTRLQSSQGYEDSRAAYPAFSQDQIYSRPSAGSGLPIRSKVYGAGPGVHSRKQQQQQQEKHGGFSYRGAGGYGAPADQRQKAFLSSEERAPAHASLRPQDASLIGKTRPQGSAPRQGYGGGGASTSYGREHYGAYPQHPGIDSRHQGLARVESEREKSGYREADAEKYASRKTISSKPSPYQMTESSYPASYGRGPQRRPDFQEERFSKSYEVSSYEENGGPQPLDERYRAQQSYKSASRTTSPVSSGVQYHQVPEQHPSSRRPSQASYADEEYADKAFSREGEGRYVESKPHHPERKYPSGGSKQQQQQYDQSEYDRRDDGRGRYHSAEGRVSQAGGYGKTSKESQDYRPEAVSGYQVHRDRLSRPLATGTVPHSEYGRDEYDSRSTERYYPSKKTQGSPQLGGPGSSYGKESTAYEKPHPASDHPRLDKLRPSEHRGGGGVAHKQQLYASRVPSADAYDLSRPQDLGPKQPPRSQGKYDEGAFPSGAAAGFEDSQSHARQIGYGAQDSRAPARGRVPISQEHYPGAQQHAEQAYLYESDDFRPSRPQSAAYGRPRSGSYPAQTASKEAASYARDQPQQGRVPAAGGYEDDSWKDGQPQLQYTSESYKEDRLRETYGGDSGRYDDDASQRSGQDRAFPGAYPAAGESSKKVRDLSPPAVALKA